MTARPLLLLDVDGVLSPYPETPEGYAEHRLFPEDDEPVRLASVHREWLGELGDGFDLVWATGWGEDANRLLAPRFGLPHLRLVPLPPVPVEPEVKARAVRAFVGDLPAAWVDDVVTKSDRAWAARRTAPTLIVHIDHRRGLRRAHVDELLAWANALLAGQPESA